MVPLETMMKEKCGQGANGVTKKRGNKLVKQEALVAAEWDHRDTQATTKIYGETTHSSVETEGEWMKKYLSNH